MLEPVYSRLLAIFAPQIILRFLKFNHKMKLRLYFLLFLVCNVCLVGQAQEIGSTFRVGLNAPQFLGDSEKGADGSNLEDFSTFTGFHVAGGVVFKLLDHFGFKAELMFTQKGTRYSYEGPSTYIFTATRSGNLATAVGTRTISNRVTNAYLELPVTGYAKYKKFEINGGISISILTGSTGIGDMTFSGISAISNDQVDFASVINHNYRKDNLEFTQNILTFQEEFFSEMTVDGEQVILLTEETAYAQWTDPNPFNGVFGKPEVQLENKVYRGLDFALNAGVSYYISQGLFFGFTASYGLRDVTNPYFEYSYSESEGINRVERSDKDRNFVLMGSVGFSF